MLLKKPITKAKDKISRGGILAKFKITTGIIAQTKAAKIPLINGA